MVEDNTDNTDLAILPSSDSGPTEVDNIRHIEETRMGFPNNLPKEYIDIIGKNAGHCKDIEVTPEEDDYFKKLENQTEQEEWMAMIYDLHR